MGTFDITGVFFGVLKGVLGLLIRTTVRPVHYRVTDPSLAVVFERRARGSSPGALFLLRQ
jgi:glycopeptide antibiotics resistance protein